MFTWLLTSVCDIRLEDFLVFLHVHVLPSNQNLLVRLADGLALLVLCMHLESHLCAAHNELDVKLHGPIALALRAQPIMSLA